MPGAISPRKFESVEPYAEANRRSQEVISSSGSGFR
jgi:hypothetical protein